MTTMNHYHLVQRKIETLVMMVDLDYPDTSHKLCFRTTVGCIKTVHMEPKMRQFIELSSVYF